MDVWKVCEKCVIAYPAKRKNQRFCSPECRVDYYEQHFKQYPEVEKVCLYCGNTFSTKCAIKQTYCRPDCRKAAARRRIEQVLGGTSNGRQELSPVSGVHP